MIKICVICQEPFEPKRSTRKTCSIECGKVYKKAYNQTPNRKAVLEKYKQSPKGKVAQKLAQKKYRQSPKGKDYHKARGKAYNQTPRRKALNKLYSETRTQKIKEEEEASLMFQIMTLNLK